MCLVAQENFLGGGSAQMGSSMSVSKSSMPMYSFLQPNYLIKYWVEAGCLLGGWIRLLGGGIMLTLLLYLPFLPFYKRMVYLSPYLQFCEC